MGNEIAGTPVAAASTESATVDTKVQAPAVAAGGAVPPDSGTPGDKGAEPSEAEKRIQQLVAQRKAAEEEAATARAQVEYYKGLAEGRAMSSNTVAPGTPQTPSPSMEEPSGPPVAPKIDDFESYEEFEAADRKYIIEQAKYDIREEYKKGQEIDRGRVRAAEWGNKVKLAAAERPDFMTTIGNPAFVQTATTARLIQGSDIGTELAYHLAKNIPEMLRLNGLPPEQAAKEIGILEYQLKQKAATPVINTNIISQAPEPHTPVVPQGSTAETDEQDLPIEEFIAKRNAKDAEARRAAASRQ